MADDNKYNIKIECGTDFVLPFTWYDENGNPYDLTGATVEAQLRETSASPDAYDFVCTHNGTGGRILLILPKESTSQISYSYGVYDVFVNLPNGTRKRPLHGEVYVQDHITKSIDGTMLYLVGVSSYDDLPEIGDINRMYYDYTNRVVYRWNGTNYVSAFYGGIADIHFKEHVDEYTDAYTIVYDNGKEFDYYISTKGVLSVEKISSEGDIFTGIVDTYRMTFSNGTYVDYQIRNGRTDVEVGINITYVEPTETLRIYYEDNTGQTAPRDGKAYVRCDGAWVPLDNYLRLASVDNSNLSIPESYLSLDEE